MAQKTHIIIHHSFTKDGKCVDWSAIRRYHVETLGWLKVGYHFGVELVGDHHEVLVGRWIDETGAHCRDLNMNTVGIGICCVGNYDDEVPVLGMWSTTVELVNRLVKEFNIPIENILGHREVQEMAEILPNHRKTCPGRTFNMDKFRSDVRASF